MKKAVILSILTLFLWSCADKEEPIFELSATERVQKKIKEYNEILKSSEHGWALEYYMGGSEIAYGGFMTTLRFFYDEKEKTDKVEAIYDWELLHDAFFKEPTTVSQYSIISNGGPSLSIDTYNKAFHFSSTPNIFPRTPKGRYADNEFLIMSYKDDIVYLKGKKYGVEMRMIKLKEPALEYMKKLRNVFSHVIQYGELKFKTLLVNNEFVPMTTDSRRLVYKQIIDGQEVTTIEPFIITDTGLRFYRPISINGVEFQELLFVNIGTEQYLKTDDDKVFLHLVEKLPFNLITYSWGVFPKNSKTVSALFTQKFEEIATVNTATYPNEQLVDKLRFGLTPDGTSGVTFASQYIDNPSKGHISIFNLKYALPSTNEISFSFKDNGSKASKYQHLMPLIEFIQDNSPYTYVKDDDANPKKVALKSTKNPEVQFTLYKLKRNGTPWLTLP